MADFFKGLAGGFGTGLQLGQQLRQRRMEDELAQAYAKPEEYTDYTPEQTREIQRLQGTGAYDVTAVPGAEGAVPTLRFAPRQGLELGQGEMLAAPTDFAPQQVQRYGGQTVAGQFSPEKLQGLQMREAARVIGANGDPVRASQLLAEANRLDREAVEAPLRLQGLRQNLDLGAQNLETGTLTIAEKRRLAEEQVNIVKAREELQALRAKGPLTAAMIADVSGRLKVDPTKFLQAEDAVNTQEIKDLKRDLSKAAMGGDTTLNKFLADKFDPDKTDNIKPVITKTRDGSFVVAYGDRVLSQYGEHKNMMTLVGGVINMIDQNPFATLTTLSTLDTQAEARAASRASANLSNVRAKGLARDDGTLAKLDKIDQQFEALSPADKNGPVGRGLLMDRNNIVAGANKLVQPGAAPRPEVTAAAVVEYAKGLIGKPSGEMKDGKPVKYNAETAAVAARRALSSQDGAAAPADPADALIAAMRNNAPAAAQRATPAGQSLVNLSNTMLPPAPVQRTQPTTSQERLRGLYLGQ